MAYSFGTSGSTPSFGFSSPAPVSPIGIGSTPAATALNNTQNSIIPKAPTPPTQPIASQVHTDTAGNSVKTTYAPVDTSSFTPAQLAAYNNAASLATVPGILSQPSPQPTASTANNAQSFNAGSNPLGTNITPMTTMYTANGTPVQVQSSNVGLNTYNAQSNPSGYFASNPTSSAPQTSSTTNTQTTPSAQTTASSVPNTYPGILGAATSAASNAANTGSAAYNTANTAAQQYQAQLSGLMAQQGQENANINASPLQIDFKQGQAAGLQSLFGAQENAASQGLASEQGLANTAAGLQSTGISGLGTATGNAAPGVANVTPPAGGVTTNTLTGDQYSNPVLAPIGSQQFYSPQPNGTSGQPATAGQSTQYTIKPGDTLNAIAAQYGIPEATLAAANPNAIPTDLQIGAPLTIPAASQGSPFTAGVVSGQQQLGTQYAQNYSAYQQSEAIRNNINSIVTQNPTLNPTQFTDVNSALSFLNGKVSNPAYAILANNIAEYVNTLAPILGVGGDTTNYKTQLAQQFLNGASNGQSLQQIMAGIAQTAAVKLQQQQSAGSSTGSVTPTYSGSAGAGTGSIVPSSSAIYNW